MLQQCSRLRVLDNTGGNVLEVIQVLGGRAKVGGIGSTLVGSIKSLRANAALANSQGKSAAAAANSKIQRAKRGEVVHAVVVQTKKIIQRKDGSRVRFSDNACVLVNGVKNAKTGIVPRGTRITGPIAEEIRKKSLSKLAGLAPMTI